MFGIIKQVLITLSSFSGSLVSMADLFSFTTCVFLNNPPCITKPTLTDISSGEYN